MVQTRSVSTRYGELSPETQYHALCKQINFWKSFRFTEVATYFYLNAKPLHLPVTVSLTVPSTAHWQNNLFSILLALNSLYGCLAQVPGSLLVFWREMLPRATYICRFCAVGRKGILLKLDQS